MIKTAEELAAGCKRVAGEYRTLYVMGCFGAPMNPSNKERYTDNHPYNRKPHRKSRILSASPDTYGFDCVNLIKGLLWGWDGDSSRQYGGAKYNCNEVPDISADQMIKVCTEVSTDFSSVEVGEVVWLPGHIGVYVGDGLVVECSPKWKDSVQYTGCLNLGKKAGYNNRRWEKHGKLPYVSYNPKKEVFDLDIPILRPGDTGEHVKPLQGLLSSYGYYHGELDGSYGPQTEKAVTKFQENNGLDPDGIAGPKTMTKALSGEVNIISPVTLEPPIQVQEPRVIFRTVEDVPEYARPVIQELVDSGILQGTGDGEINMSEDLLRSQLLTYRQIAPVKDSLNEILSLLEKLSISNKEVSE